MKLVELLARELKGWPEKARLITQDINFAVFAFCSDKKLPVCRDSGFWYSPEGEDLLMHDFGFNSERLASDHATAIVTRDQWEAEKARIAGKETWLRHRGRKCPVQSGTLVDLKLRSGVIHRSKFCDNHEWIHTGKPFDVMYYRLSEPDEQLARLEVVEQLQEQCAGLVDSANSLKQDGPLEWRDRIHAIDAQRAELEATYQRRIGEIAKERGELVERLAGEGLALVEVQVQPVEDMSDWRNWRAGDELIYISDEYDNIYTKGKSYKVESVQADCAFVFDDCGGVSACAIEDSDADKFKWHSRPAS